MSEWGAYSTTIGPKLCTIASNVKGRTLLQSTLLLFLVTLLVPVHIFTCVELYFFSKATTHGIVHRSVVCLCNSCWVFMLNAKVHKFEAIVGARIRAWGDKFLVTPAPTPTWEYRHRLRLWLWLHFDSGPEKLSHPKLQCHTAHFPARPLIAAKWGQQRYSTRSQAC